MSLDIVNFQTAATLLGWDQVINQAKSLQSTLGALPGTTIYQLGAQVTSTFDTFGQTSSVRGTSVRGPLSMRVNTNGMNAASPVNVFDLNVSQNNVAERTSGTLDPVIFAQSALFLAWNALNINTTFGTGSSTNVYDKMGVYLNAPFRSPVLNIQLPDYQSQTTFDTNGYDSQTNYAAYSVADVYVSPSSVGVLAASDIQSVALNATSAATTQPLQSAHVMVTLKVASKANDFVVGNVVSLSAYSPWYWNAKYVVNGVDTAAGILYLLPRDAAPLYSYAFSNTPPSMRVTFTSLPAEGDTIKLGGATYTFTYLTQVGGGQYTNKIIVTGVTTVAQLASTVNASLFSSSPDVATRAGRVPKMAGYISQYTNGNAYIDLMDVALGGTNTFSAADFGSSWGGVTFGNYVAGVINSAPVNIAPTTIGNVTTIEFRRFGVGYHGQPILFPTASVARWSDYTTNAFAGQLFNWREGYAAAGAGYGFYLSNGKSFQKIGDGAYAMSISASQTVPNATGSSVQDGMDISSCRSLQVTATTTGLTVTIPTASPHNPYNGQRLRIINPGTNQFTIAYSGVKTVGGAALAVPAKSSVEFEYVKSAGAWFQVSSVLTVA